MKLDVLIRIRLKKGYESFLSYKPINLKLRVHVFEMGNNNRLRHTLAHHGLSICLINYGSIDGSRVATCRMEGFKLSSGLGPLCVLLCSWAGHFNLTVTLSTQVYKWVPANLMLRVTVWKCKEAVCSTKCDMHWKTQDCNGK